MTIIPQRPEDKPACPQSGIAGGPIHPAHAVEVAFANRVYAVTPPDDSEEYTRTMDEMATAASARPGMELYVLTASPIMGNQRLYFSSAYFHCLVCGFILPVQQVTR